MTPARKVAVVTAPAIMITLKWEAISRVRGRGSLVVKMWWTKSFRCVGWRRRLELGVLVYGEGEKGGGVRFGVLGGVFGMSVESGFHVRSIKIFEEGEEAGNHADGAHYVVHVGCVDDYVGPVVAMFLLSH